MPPTGADQRLIKFIISTFVEGRHSEEEEGNSEKRWREGKKVVASVFGNWSIGTCTNNSLLTDRLRRGTATIQHEKTTILIFKNSSAAVKAKYYFFSGRRLSRSSEELRRTIFYPETTNMILLCSPSSFLHATHINKSINDYCKLATWN